MFAEDIEIMIFMHMLLFRTRREIFTVAPMEAAKG
jgi:hypothetical protein